MPNDETKKGFFKPYMPGTEDVVKKILKYEFIKTTKEEDTDKESMYLYIKPGIGNTLKEGTYIRGEDEIKEIAERYWKLEIIKNLNQLKKISEERGTRKGKKSKKDEDEGNLKKELERKLKHDGITHHEIIEVMQNLRRKTFVDRKTMNPDGYIPLKNGLLSISDWKLHEFSPNEFYTWKAFGTYDPNIVSLEQTPLFKKFLLESYPPHSIPTILDYMGYSLYPAFPRQKILVIVGPPRMGKGTIGLIMAKILNEGLGRISLMKMLIPDNKFALQGIDGKRLLLDPEIKRDFKKNVDFDVVNSLFGGDPLPIEKKYHAEVTSIANCAGMLMGNLPLFKINNSAFLARLLIVTTREERYFQEVPNTADIIFNGEGDLIVGLILNRLKSLIERGFTFSNELTNGEYANMWEILSDSTQTFMDEKTEKSNNDVEVELAYEKYKEYCSEKKIPPESRHVFTVRMGRIFPKIRIKKEGRSFYTFQNCSILTLIDLKVSEKNKDDEKKALEKKEKIDDITKELAGDIFLNEEENYQNEDSI